jgi:hypothetical protein
MGVLMTKLTYALCAIIPLAWGAAALAAPPNAPEAAPPATMAERHHGDMGAWHKDMCTEHYARTASHLAYLQAKLGLSEQQAAAFGKWRQAVLDQSTKERAACLEMTPKGNAKPTMLDREAHLEKMLAAKLQSLQATRPALEAVYEGLTAEQKTIFDHAVHHHLHAMRGGHRGGMDGHMDMEPGR